MNSDVSITSPEGGHRPFAAWVRDAHRPLYQERQSSDGNPTTKDLPGLHLATIRDRQERWATFHRQGQLYPIVVPAGD